MKFSHALDNVFLSKFVTISLEIDIILSGGLQFGGSSQNMLRDSSSQKVMAPPHAVNRRLQYSTRSPR
jgi:hypothetical protein